MTFSRRLLVGLSLIALVLLAGPALGKEKIRSFDSRIDVRSDGSMLVRETIEVRAEGKEINRGIYRDFPTRYRDRFGTYHTIPFRVKSVQRDGEPEPHFTEQRSNGVRLYIGKEDRYIDPGVYEYQITYETDRAIGHFEDHDELYWDVTGHKWDFPIEEASVTVNLPADVEASRLQVDAYTGYQGSRKENYEITKRKPGIVALRSTEPFQPNQGLTVAVGWPKGIVEEPTVTEKMTYVLRDNVVVLTGILCVLLVLLYYVVVWIYVGIDPEKGVIIPRYEPPEDLSPSAIRYVHEMGYDDRTFTTALVNLAVNGFIEIEKNSGDYTLRKLKSTDTSVSDGELGLMSKLFSTGEELELEQDNHERIQDAMEVLEDELEDGYLRKFFYKNFGYFLGGAALSLVSLSFVYYLGASELAELTMVFFLAIWSFSVGGMAKKTYRTWQRFFRTRGTKKLLGALAATAFSLPFLAVEVVLLLALLGQGGLQFFVLAMVLLGINLLFYVLLKAPTVQGRELMDKIQGFKRYLSVGEKQRLDLEELPEKTPELFEQLLPYAIALEVGNEWAESFTDVFDMAEETDDGYRPTWYHGTYQGTQDLTDTVSHTLSSAVATSSTSPSSSSSSSGLGGGGVSGGGVGGGGGGGW